MTARCALLFLLGTAAFAQSTHWSAGLGLGYPTAYAAGGSLCYNVNVQYGRELDAKWGYRLGLGVALRDKSAALGHMEEDPETGYLELVPLEVLSGFLYASFGGYCAVSKNSLDLYANVRFGPYLAERTIINHGTERLAQYTAGLEAGARKRITSGLWLNASYSYAPLDKEKVKAGSMQWVGLGLEYIWGRKYSHSPWE